MSQFKEIAQDLYDVAYEQDDSVQKMAYFYEKTSTFIETGLQDPQLRGEKLDCISGCAACCHLPVKCPPEAVFFIQHVMQQTLSAEHLEELTLLLRTYVDKWQELSEKQKEKTRLACPFLDPNNTCLIYDIRPFSCRAFTSTDVRICEQVLHQPEDLELSVPQNSFIFSVYQLATTILSSVAKSKDRDPEQVYFIPTLLVALENDQLEINWKKGEKL